MLSSLLSDAPSPSLFQRLKDSLFASRLAPDSLTDVMREGNIERLRAYHARAERHNWRDISDHTVPYLWGGEPDAEVGRLFFDIFSRVRFCDEYHTPLERFQRIIQRAPTFHSHDLTHDERDACLTLMLSLLAHLDTIPVFNEPAALLNLLEPFPRVTPFPSSTELTRDFFTPFRAFLRARFPFEDAATRYIPCPVEFTMDIHLVANFLMVYQDQGYAFLRAICVNTPDSHYITDHPPLYETLTKDSAHEQMAFCARLQDTDIQAMTVRQFLDWVKHRRFS